jgi:hypothetical protein
MTLRPVRAVADTFLLAVAAVIVVAGAATYANTMQPSDRLHNGDSLFSDDSAYYLTFENNGTGYYTLISNACGIGWSSFSDGHPNTCVGAGSHSAQSADAGSSGFAQMQSDGNFVLYTGGSSSVWATNTNGHTTGPFLSLQTDGNLIVYYNTNVALWSLF